MRLTESLSKCHAGRQTRHLSSLKANTHICDVVRRRSGTNRDTLLVLSAPLFCDSQITNLENLTEPRLFVCIRHIASGKECKIRAGRRYI